MMKSPRALCHSALIVAVIATFAGVPERTAFALPADLAARLARLESALSPDGTLRCERLVIMGAHGTPRIVAAYDDVDVVRLVLVSCLSVISVG